MAAFSGSSASKLLAVAIWASVFFVVVMEVPSSMAARTVPADNLSGENDAANPKWPCCRQYQDPPSAVETAEATAVVGPIVTATTALAPADHPTQVDNSDNNTANPEWPCCRQYEDLPSVPAEETAEATAAVGPVVTATTALAPADHPIDREAFNSDDNTANPEWPCCRQYDEPPSGTNSDTTFEATVHNFASEVAGVDVAHKHHHHTASPPYLGHGSEEQVVDNEKAGSSSKVTVEKESEAGAEPEWPCCRQYDVPPGAIEGNN